MKRIGFSALSFVFTLSAFAAPSAKIPESLLKVEKKYSQAKSFAVDFEQTDKSAITGMTKVSTGQLFFKTPGKMRWQTLSPDPTVLVSDGKTVWLYTPPFGKGQRGQVIVSSAAKVKSEFANHLLGGEFSKTKFLKIDTKSESNFILVPHPGSAGDLQRAEIEVNAATSHIDRVVLDYRSGNHSDIKFSNLKLGAQMDDPIFKFKSPENTDRIER